MFDMFVGNNGVYHLLKNLHDDNYKITSSENCKYRNNINFSNEKEYAINCIKDCEGIINMLNENIEKNNKCLNEKYYNQDSIINAREQMTSLVNDFRSNLEKWNIFLNKIDKKDFMDKQYKRLNHKEVRVNKNNMVVYGD